MCTDKCGYSCLVLPTLRNTAPSTCSKCLLSCHFSLAICRFGFFSPQGRKKLQGTDRHCSLFHTSNLEPSYVEVLHSQGSYLTSLPFQPKHSSYNSEVLVQSSAPAEQRESCVWPKLLLMQHVLANQSELGLSLLKMLGKTTSELFTQFPSRHFSVDK